MDENKVIHRKGAKDAECRKEKHAIRSRLTGIHLTEVWRKTIFGFLCDLRAFAPLR
jgi:hypothetical protein